MVWTKNSTNPYFTLYAAEQSLQAIHFHETDEVLSFGLEGEPVEGLETLAVAGTAQLQGVGEFLLGWFSTAAERNLDTFLEYAGINPEFECEYIWALKPLQFITWLTETSRARDAEEDTRVQCVAPVLRSYQTEAQIDTLLVLAYKYSLPLEYVDGFYWLSDYRWTLSPQGFFVNFRPEVEDELSTD